MQLLILAGIAISLAMLFTGHGDLIVQDRDGSSRLLQWVTMLWPSWQIVPSIATAGVRHSAALIAIWIAVACLVAGQPNLFDTPGSSALNAITTIAAAILIVASIAPGVTHAEPASVTEPEARSRLPMLDDFDSLARPHAIIYHPFTIARAADIPPLMTLAAEPGLRGGGQPMRVFLNARYALAAGDYRVEIGGLKTSEPVRGFVGLQVGRNGSPLQEWPVELAPGGSWKATFSLPVDAEFVGFVISDSLASASSLRLTPLTIVNKNNRESSFHGASRSVLSAVSFPAASIFFHDEDVYPEQNGFWVRGGSTAYMTVAANHPDEGVTLRVHSEGRPNSVIFETTTWGERLQLQAGTPRDVHIPAPARPGPFLLRMTAANGFVPSEMIPGNTDRRMLGCWVEIVEE